MDNDLRGPPPPQCRRPINEKKNEGEKRRQKWSLEEEKRGRS